MSDWDVKTTPKRLRVPAALFLAALAGYFLLCFHYVYQSKPSQPQWVALGGWSMFTSKSRYATDVEGEMLVDGKWVDAELTKLFPSTWSSGPRYVRGSFRRNNGRVRTLAASTCHRSTEAPDRVRIIEVKWRKRLGSLARNHQTRKTLLDHDCTQTVKLPGGRTL